MDHSLNQFGFITKAFSSFLYWVAVLIIVILPIVSSLYGKHHTYNKTNTITNAHHLSGLTHADAWSIIKDRHLAVPHISLRIKAATVITLLFALFFAGLAQQTEAVLNNPNYKESPFLPYQLYLLNQNLLI